MTFLKHKSCQLNIFFNTISLLLGWEKNLRHGLHGPTWFVPADLSLSCLASHQNSQDSSHTGSHSIPNPFCYFATPPLLQQPIGKIWFCFETVSWIQTLPIIPTVRILTKATIIFHLGCCHSLLSDLSLPFVLSHWIHFQSPISMIAYSRSQIICFLKSFQRLPIAIRIKLKVLKAYSKALPDLVPVYLSVPILYHCPTLVIHQSRWPSF